MEIRYLNVLFTKSGSGSETTRLSIPITWVREMGITKEDRQVKVLYEDGKIIISK